MTVLRGYKCDVCGDKTWDYQPHNWRNVRYSSMPMRQGIDVNEQGQVCSDNCEYKWHSALLNELGQAMEGPDYDEIADEMRDEKDYE